MEKEIRATRVEGGTIACGRERRLEKKARRSSKENLEERGKTEKGQRVGIE